jgi:hypothetical protein
MCGAALVAALSVSATASAATLTIDAVSRGAYKGDTGEFGTGFSGQPGGNYLTGWFADFPPNQYELRSFFVFDLSAITDPIVSATFVATVGLVRLPDGSETLSLFDISSSLDAVTNNTGGIAAFNDFGSGTSYGSRAFTPADAGFLLPVAIGLNAAAISDLNAASGLFGIGGALTSIVGVDSQLVFGSTGPSDSLSRLVLETAPQVPEPSSLVLLGTCVAALALRRRRRQH